MAAETMKAVVLRGWDDLAVETIERPAVGPDEILIRVRACVGGYFAVQSWVRGTQRTGSLPAAGRLT